MPDSPTRILVTGGTGFIGERLVQTLTEMGHEVTVVTRDASQLAGTTTSIECADPSLVPQSDLTGFLAVFHLAGISDPAARPIEVFDQVNNRSTVTLAQKAADAGVQNFVFLSSAKVFGEVSPPDGFNADSPVAASGEYGQSKAAAEQGLRKISQNSDLKVTVFRPPPVLGGKSNGNLGLLQRLVDRGVPLPVPKADAARSFIHVSSLVADLVTFGMTPRAPFEVRVVADEHPASTRELLETMAIESGTVLRMVPLPEWLFRAADAALIRLGLATLSPLFRDFSLVPSSSQSPPQTVDPQSPLGT